ncbi:MAG: succinate dehydrogenase, cytochrome b556 subunit [Alphaproteobacteria bacterium]|uniref:Succinate dehydrogenase cytochrome b556 subunit n=1 Tax=Candidatus Nitrobium versatile TaxID=2884831 RepID=A0A953LWH0_9BACT|nr:succinate dehydrogenase, cytochrome b556 subunit [Candidatus Nitrobium versatile]
MRYKLRTGSLAWLIHRVTGVALTLYVFLHLYVLSHLRDPEEYEKLMAMMKNPLVKLSEVGLLALVTAHALNGVRVTLLELGLSTRLQKPLFWTAVAVGIVICLAGARVFLGGGH